MPVFASEGHTTHVHRFQIYDVMADELITSRRLATEAAIERIGGIRLAVAFEVPAADVDADGFTAKDYVPVRGASA